MTTQAKSRPHLIDMLDKLTPAEILELDVDRVYGGLHNLVTDKEQPAEIRERAQQWHHCLHRLSISRFDFMLDARIALRNVGGEAAECAKEADEYDARIMGDDCYRPVIVHLDFEKIHIEVEQIALAAPKLENPTHDAIHELENKLIPENKDDAFNHARRMYLWKLLYWLHAFDTPKPWTWKSFDNLP